MFFLAIVLFVLYGFTASYFSYCILQTGQWPKQKFEDTRGEVRIRKSTTDRQDYSQKKSLKIQEEK
jgi:hypothetical protein